MRIEFKPKSLVMPCPVLLISTYNEDGSVDCMNAAWGGVYDTNQIYICLASDHKTSHNIKKCSEFSVGFATSNIVKEADYLGCVSGNDIPNKFELSKLTTSKAKNVNAPIINEIPLSLECKVNKIDEYDDTLHLVADIISVNADESIVVDGKLDVSNVEFISFDPIHNKYRKCIGFAGNAFKTHSI